MNNSFILLAAGHSKRFNSKIPKQFNKIKGITILEHSINIAVKSKLFNKIVIVVQKTHKKYIKDLDQKRIKIVYGGKTRQESSLNALKYLKKFNPMNVFIHDAARPYINDKLITRIYKNILKNNAVVPYINCDDSTKFKKNKKMLNINRNNIFLVQTPQCFKYNLIYKLSIENKNNITDESSLLIDKNIKIKFIKGEKSNIKITRRKDIDKKDIKTFYGVGFDIHRLVKNKKLFLGGIKIPFHSGLKGHSDGDVILHCIIDALLGALRKKDIGSIYPNHLNKYKNIRSKKMLKPIIDELKNSNYYINNLDINLICERPKVSIYRDKIINSLCKIMCINKKIINLKGKTVEKLGLIGKEKAIACESVVSICKYE